MIVTQISLENQLGSFFQDDILPNKTHSAYFNSGCRCVWLSWIDLCIKAVKFPYLSLKSNSFTRICIEIYHCELVFIVSNELFQYVESRKLS